MHISYSSVVVNLPACTCDYLPQVVRVYMRPRIRVYMRPPDPWRNTALITRGHRLCGHCKHTRRNFTNIGLIVIFAVVKQSNRLQRTFRIETMEVASGMGYDNGSIHRRFGSFSTTWAIPESRISRRVLSQMFDAWRSEVKMMALLSPELQAVW